MTTRFLVNHKGETHEFLVDDADADAVAAQAPWSLVTSSKGNPYVGRDHRGAPGPRVVLLHRQLMLATPGLEVDHINGDTLDDRRINMRLATHGQQLQNLGISRTNTSGFRGVSWHSGNRKWAAYVRANGKLNHLGYFADRTSAALVAREARAKFHPYAVESRHPVEVGE